MANTLGYIEIAEPGPTEPIFPDNEFLPEYAGRTPLEPTTADQPPDLETDLSIPLSIILPAIQHFNHTTGATGITWPVEKIRDALHHVVDRPTSIRVTALVGNDQSHSMTASEVWVKLNEWKTTARQLSLTTPIAYYPYVYIAGLVAHSNKSNYGGLVVEIDLHTILYADFGGTPIETVISEPRTLERYIPLRRSFAPAPRWINAFAEVDSDDQQYLIDLYTGTPVDQQGTHIVDNVFDDFSKYELR